ncbi:MAG: hypothetical protein ABR555_13400 [Pyrinomonadaceae bacterium]
MDAEAGGMIRKAVVWLITALFDPFAEESIIYLTLEMLTTDPVRRSNSKYKWPLVHKE